MCDCAACRTPFECGPVVTHRDVPGRMYQLPIYLVFKFATPAAVVAITRIDAISVELIDGHGTVHSSIEAATESCQRRAGLPTSNLGWSAWFVRTTFGFGDACYVPQWHFALVSARRRTVAPPSTLCTAAPRELLTNAAAAVTGSGAPRQAAQRSPATDANGGTATPIVTTVAAATHYSTSPVTRLAAAPHIGTPVSRAERSKPFTSRLEAPESKEVVPQPAANAEATLRATPAADWTVDFLGPILVAGLAVPTLTSVVQARVLPTGLTTMTCTFVHPTTWELINMELNTTLLVVVPAYARLLDAAQHAPPAAAVPALVPGKRHKQAHKMASGAAAATGPSCS